MGGESGRRVTKHRLLTNTAAVGHESLISTCASVLLIGHLIVCVFRKPLPTDPADHLDIRHSNLTSQLYCPAETLKACSLGLLSQSLIVSQNLVL